MQTNNETLEITFHVDGEPFTGTVWDNQPRSHWDGDLEARVSFSRIKYVCNGIKYRLDVTVTEYNHGSAGTRLLDTCHITREDGREATDAGRSKGWAICRDLRDQVATCFEDKVRPLAIRARINRCEAEAKRAQTEAEKWNEAAIKARRIAF